LGAHALSNNEKSFSLGLKSTLQSMNEISLTSRPQGVGAVRKTKHSSGARSGRSAAYSEQSISSLLVASAYVGPVLVFRIEQKLRLDLGPIVTNFTE
jgi:hypothetical protein